MVHLVDVDSHPYCFIFVHYAKEASLNFISYTTRCRSSSQGPENKNGHCQTFVCSRHSFSKKKINASSQADPNERYTTRHLRKQTFFSHVFFDINLRWNGIWNWDHSEWWRRYWEKIACRICVYERYEHTQRENRALRRAERPRGS